MCVICWFGCVGRRGGGCGRPGSWPSAETFALMMDAAGCAAAAGSWLGVPVGVGMRDAGKLRYASVVNGVQPLQECCVVVLAAACSGDVHLSRHRKTRRMLRCGTSSGVGRTAGASRRVGCPAASRWAQPLSQVHREPQFRPGDTLGPSAGSAVRWRSCKPTRKRHPRRRRPRRPRSPPLRSLAQPAAVLAPRRRTQPLQHGYLAARPPALGGAGWWSHRLPRSRSRSVRRPVQARRPPHARLP